MSSIVTTLQTFKDRFGVYPPSQMILMENGDYSTATMGSASVPGQSGMVNLVNGGVHTPTQGVGGVFLRDVSVQYLRRIWPQISLNTSGSAGNAPGIVTTGPAASQFFYDWNGNGVYDSGAYLLSGDECLAFFLGGIPTGEPHDNSAIRTGQGPPGCLGFSKNPINPTLPPIAGTATAGRDGPFYEFDSGRLVDWDQNGFWEFLPLRRPARVGGYAYFSSYEGSGYRPDDMNIDSTNTAATEPSGINSIPSSCGFIEYRVNWQRPAGYPAAYTPSYASPSPPTNSVLSPGPNPYTIGLPMNDSVPIVRYWKPDGFQLISPGINGDYGQGGAIERRPTARGSRSASPSTPAYEEVKEDDDTLTNFATIEVKDAGSK